MFWCRRVVRWAPLHRLRALLDRTVEEARERGFVTTLLGRRRYLPDLTRINLRGAYGAYDPNFNFSIGDDFNRSAGTQLAPGIISPALEQYQESFSSGLSGLLPTGTRYDFRGNVLRNRGDRSGGAVNPGDWGYFDYFGGATATVTQPLHVRTSRWANP